MAGHSVVLRIRDDYPGSEFFPSRILVKEFKYFNPKKWLLSSRKYDPSCSSRIRILTFYPFRIQGSKGHRIPDPDPQHWHSGMYRYSVVGVVNDTVVLVCLKWNCFMFPAEWRIALPYIRAIEINCCKFYYSFFLCYFNTKNRSLTCCNLVLLWLRAQDLGCNSLVQCTCCKHSLLRVLSRAILISPTCEWQ